VLGSDFIELKFKFSSAKQHFIDFPPSTARRALSTSLVGMNLQALFNYS
jgi:hypothetical protein